MNTNKLDYKIYLNSLGYSTNGTEEFEGKHCYYFETYIDGQDEPISIATDKLKKLAKIAFEKRYKYLKEPIKVDINDHIFKIDYIDENNALNIYNKSKREIATCEQNLYDAYDSIKFLQTLLCQIEVYLGFVELVEVKEKKGKK